MVKTVYNWGQRRELLGMNRLALYRFKVAKDLRREPPAEYTREEREAILQTLHPDRHTEWRAWAAVAIAAYQGARMRAILHVQWSDLDFEAAQITWRARWDKTGRERVQPMTDGTRVALVVAKQWRDHDGYTGPWVLYTPHRQRWNAADGERARPGPLRRSGSRSGRPSAAPACDISCTGRCTASDGQWRETCSNSRGM